MLPSQPFPLLGTAHLRELENTHAHALGKYKRVRQVGVGREGSFVFFRLGGVYAGQNTRRGQWGEQEREGKRERQEPRYLTDNVIIVSQCTGMRDVRRGVAQFPYIWVGALSDGGQREIIIVLLRGWPVLTAGCGRRDGRGVEGNRRRTHAVQRGEGWGKGRWR